MSTVVADGQPGRAEIAAWFGDPLTIEVRLTGDGGAGVDLTGQPVVLKYSWEVGETVFVSADIAMTLADQTVAETRGVATVELTEAQVEAMPRGRGRNGESPVRYEISADGRTVLFGTIIVTKWNSTDA